MKARVKGLIYVDLLSPLCTWLSCRGSSPQEKAKEHIDGLLQLIVAKLNQDQGIVDKKGQYLLLGSRGDWPELQPEGWKPQDHVA